MSVIHFGTDGWRGTIAREFTFENVRKVSQAVATFLSHCHPRKGSLVIGHDRRFLSEEFARVSAEVLAGNGFKVFLFSKPVPTPLVTFTVVQKHLLGGIVLTASHNPPEFQGFKFKEPWGASATSRTTRQIERHLGRRKVRLFPFTEAVKQKKIIVTKPDHSYLSFLRKRIDLSLFRRTSLKILTDGLYGSASDYLPQALSVGSIRVESLHTERDVLFGGLTPEPFPAHLGELTRKMREARHDIGIALDGDGDRMAAVLPGGRFLHPNKIFALILYHFAEAKCLRGLVVRTVSGSGLIDRIAAAYGMPLEETPIGFKYIAERMVGNRDFLIGGEESGGMGFRGSLPERDGILSSLFLLEAMAFSRKPLSVLLQRIRNRFGPSESARIDLPYPKEKWKVLTRRIRREARRVLGEPLSKMSDLDGMKLVGKTRWLLFRMSGTEPLLRIYAEAPSENEVKKLLKQGEVLASRELKG